MVIVIWFLGVIFEVGMKFMERALIALLGLAMLVALHQLVSILMSTHNWRGLTAGDWATWIGAIGTVATLGMTIRIATTETRRRRHEELLRANITAAALAPRIQVAARMLNHFKTRLMFQNLEGAPYRTAAEEAEFLLGINFPEATTEELLILAGLEGNLASKLAYAQARLGVVRVTIKNSTEQDPERLLSSQDAKKWEAWTEELAERFSVIASRCARAASVHAPAPTPEELYGPQ